MSGSDDTIADDARAAADDARGGSSQTNGPGRSSEGGSQGSGGASGNTSGATGGRGSEGSSATAQGQAGTDNWESDRAERKKRSCMTCPEWRYEMGIRKLGGVPYLYSWHHLFVVQWNRGGSGGTMMTYSAFPSRKGNPGIAGPIFGAMQSDSSKTAEEGYEEPAEGEVAEDDMGYLQFKPSLSYWRSGEYAPGNRFVTLRDTDQNMRSDLMAQGNEIDAKRIHYVGTGPNSNSFAMSLAERVGLPRRKPAGDAPGSGMSI